ncbi:MAG TPA: F0F1 ATP synthase subunit B [Candidatus Paceibacterota bacterium]|jgi:F-type H+-transporting ATPase subunit b|nr:F0F1 ATP synthase subunit B [Candidatus Paceibacterota bacterium]
MGALFSAFGVDWHLLVIQAVNFALLLFALTYFLYRPILRIIDERREKVAEGVRLANMAEQKLEDAKHQGEGMVADAAKEAEGLVAVARTRASEMTAETTRAAEAKADAILKDAQARAEEQKRLVLQESSKEIARAAMLAAEKILKEKNA